MGEAGEAMHLFYACEADDPSMENVLDGNELNYYLHIRAVMMDYLRSQANQNRKIYMSLAASVFSDWIRSEGELL